MSINVTHIVRQYLPSVGGMEEVVRNIAMHQARTGQQHTRIITLDRLFRNTSERLPKREEIGGVEVVRLPYYGSSRYPLCPSILGQLGSTDVVHVHGVDFFYDFLAVTKWWHRRPLVLSTHGGFFHTSFASRMKEAYFATVTRLSAKAYNQVVATSANDGQLFSRIMSEPKLKVIENGVDVDKYHDQSSRTLQPTLMYFGRWSSNKGLLEALQLMAQLKVRDPRWRLIIAGREYDHSLAELQGRVAELGIQDHVQLAANPSDEEIRSLLQQASYFICLSRHEGFGIAPIEGMSAGLTPLLSDIPPFQRLAKRSGLGFTISTNAPLDTAIDSLLQLHAEGQDAYLARRRIAMSFSRQYAWPRVAERYLELYDKLGGRPS
ncbi:MAG: glycosyltransferase family 4 protein [Cellvibrio sp.]|jgi:Glycosyltransferase